MGQNIYNLVLRQPGEGISRLSFFFGIDIKTGNGDDKLCLNMRRLLPVFPSFFPSQTPGASKTAAGIELRIEEE